MRLSYSDVLRIRTFRDLWLGQAISQLGDAFYYVAFMFMVKKVTGSDAMVGIVGALETLPFLLFGPYAGVLADRLDRRKIMLASDLVSGAALVLFGITIAINGKPPLAALLIVPFLLSTVRVFFMPAKSAAIPSVVPPNALMTANALSMTTGNLMPMISLGLTAGVLSILFKLSPALFYFSTVSLNALSFLGSALYIARLPKLLPDRTGLEGSKAPGLDGSEGLPFNAEPLSPEPSSLEPATSGALKPERQFVTDLKEGLNYLRSRHDLVVMTVIMAIFRLSVAPFFVVYLAANDQWFGGKPETVAWFEFSFFVGMVVASGYAGRLRPKHPAKIFCVGLLVVGLTVGAMAFTPNFWLFILWNVIAGLAIPVADLPMMSYMQLTVPDAFRGRVNAVRDMIATGVMPLGMTAAGFLVKAVGVAPAFLAMGLGMTLACTYGLLDPRFRDVEMPEESGAPSSSEADGSLSSSEAKDADSDEEGVGGGANGPSATLR